jgi:hypothetical protein
MIKSLTRPECSIPAKHAIALCGHIALVISNILQKMTTSSFPIPQQKMDVIRKNGDRINMPTALLLKPIKIGKDEFGHTRLRKPIAGIIHGVKTILHSKKLLSGQLCHGAF